jgi:hypothetical protein
MIFIAQFGGDALLAGTAGVRFMARTKTAILIGQTHERGRDFTLRPASWDHDHQSQK